MSSFSQFTKNERSRDHAKAMESKAGDPCRQGRAKPDEAPLKQRLSVVKFLEASSGHHSARVAAITCGHIRPCIAGLPGEHEFLCLLPDMSGKWERRRDIGEAKTALRIRIETWFEASGHVVSARRQIELRRDAENVSQRR